MIESLGFGVLLAGVGGFLDAYTYILKDGVFANAQTGNVVLIAVDLSTGKAREALKFLPPIAAFVIGVLVAEIVKNPPLGVLKKNWASVILALESAVLFFIGFLPKTVPDLVVTATVSFIAAIQVSSFNKLVDSPYATTMVTGNLRTFVTSAYFSFRNRDRGLALRSLRFLTGIVAFGFGAVVGGLSVPFLDVRSIWIAAASLFALLVVSLLKRS